MGLKVRREVRGEIARNSVEQAHTNKRGGKGSETGGGPGEGRTAEVTEDRRVRTEKGSLEFLGYEQPLGEQCP